MLRLCRQQLFFPTVKFPQPSPEMFHRVQVAPDAKRPPLDDGTLSRRKKGVQHLRPDLGCGVSYRRPGGLFLTVGKGRQRGGIGVRHCAALFIGWRVRGFRRPRRSG